jgi:hypothetical protein
VIAGAPGGICAPLGIRGVSMIGLPIGFVLLYLGPPMLEISMIAEATITCPTCGASIIGTIPTDTCEYFYECTGCGALRRPRRGDCRVFCSYGTVPRPSMQTSGGQPS